MLRLLCQLFIVTVSLCLILWISGCGDDDNPVVSDDTEETPLDSVFFVADTLFGLDENDSILWSYKAGSSYTVAMVGDLDGDGLNEAVAGTNDDGNVMAMVYAIDGDGTRIFRYTTGVGPANGPYWPDSQYAISQIAISDVDNDNFMEVISSSYHTTWYPGRICIISKSGNLEGEYWHPGRDIKFVITDFDNNGVKDIVCGAGNNDLGAIAAVFLLAGDNVNGEAPPDLGDFPAGSQAWYTANNYTASSTYADYCAEIALVDVVGDSVPEIRYTDLDGYKWYCDKNGTIVTPSGSYCNTIGEDFQVSNSIQPKNIGKGSTIE